MNICTRITLQLTYQIRYNGRVDDVLLCCTNVLSKRENTLRNLRDSLRV